MRWKNIAALSILAAGLIGGSVKAAPISWNIVSTASSISLAIPNQTFTITSSATIQEPLFGTSLTVTMRALNPGTGASSAPTGWTIGNKQNVSGMLQTDTDFQSYIKFLDVPDTAPNLINGIDSGVYAPLPNGSAGTASGDFGTRLFTGAGLGGNWNLDMALRSVLYELTSDTIATSGTLNNHTFAASDTDFSLDNADIAYRSRNGGGLGGAIFLESIGSGAANVSGLTTDNTAGNGSMIVTETPGGYLATLTVPITQSFFLSYPFRDEEIRFKVNLTGTIVATAIVPEPATSTLLAVGMAMLVPMAARRWRKRE